MGQERKLFKSEEPKQRSEVSEFLHQIAAKIEAGQVILRQGQEEITLDMPANLILEIQVEEEDKKSKGIQHSLEIEIKWFEGDGDGGAGGSLELG
jgi:amphi-Trp domain-containing protein